MKKRALRCVWPPIALVAAMAAGQACASHGGSESPPPSPAPEIISVAPANNAVDVPRNISSVDITFDQDMQARASVTFEGDGQFGHDIQWQDPRTVEIRVLELLQAGFSYTLTLNKSTSASSDYFRSTAGTALALDTPIAFTTDTIDLYYTDVRPFTGSDISALDLNEYVIKSLWYNESTVFNAGCQALAQEILEKGKNPGLGVLALHEQGITGKDVNVAIIDQNLASLTHPEFAGRVVEYKDFGTGQPSTSGSMHAPAVLSLLAGASIGTAPEARIYFAAVPSWLADAQYYADALDWLVATNAGLPADQKIRIVSVSAAPSGPGTPYTKNNAAWDAAVVNARNAGITVLDCTVDKGIIGPGFYDINDPDNISKFRAGYPKSQLTLYSDKLVAPCSLRTQAEEYDAGVCSYQYTGYGGLSWTIPYVTGVLAMGFQLKPGLTNDEMIQILFDTGHLLPDGNKVIDPAAFINALKTMGSPPRRPRPERLAESSRPTLG